MSSVDIQLFKLNIKLFNILNYDWYLNYNFKQQYLLNMWFLIFSQYVAVRILPVFWGKLSLMSAKLIMN